MTALSYQTLEQLWIEAGGPPSAAPTAAAIAIAESGGDPSAVQKGQPYATTGWGLWQITPGNSEPQFGTDQSLLTPINNARAAVAKFKAAGNSFTPWTTYVDGAYKRYLNGADYSGTGTLSNITSGPPPTTGVFVWQVNLGPINTAIDMDGFIGIIAIISGGLILAIGVIVVVTSTIRRPLEEAIGIDIATRPRRQPQSVRTNEQPTEEERQAKLKEQLEKVRTQEREKERLKRVRIQERTRERIKTTRTQVKAEERLKRAKAQERAKEQLASTRAKIRAEERLKRAKAQERAQERLKRVLAQAKSEERLKKARARAKQRELGASKA